MPYSLNNFPPDSESLENIAILKKLNSAHRYLAELKGICHSIPNQSILINTLVMQEAKDSSEIENIITTHDELFREAIFPNNKNGATKEVENYSSALYRGFKLIKTDGFLSTNHILTIQKELEKNRAGFRRLPGTELRNDITGKTVYMPPQHPDDITRLMATLEQFINTDDHIDPLVRMALIHHQFESIHPFYDGNGRTGRIINVLFLVMVGLLDIPVLYLSRYLVKNKNRYYKLLQSVRETGNWQEWILYMLEAVENTAQHSIITIKEISTAMLDYKHRIRREFSFYSQDLINHLFCHPYTKINFLSDSLKISRPSATKYLESLVEAGFLHKEKMGRSNYYINIALCNILTQQDEISRDIVIQQIQAQENDNM